MMCCSHTTDLRPSVLLQLAPRLGAQNLGRHLGGRVVCGRGMHLLLRVPATGCGALPPLFGLGLCHSLWVALCCLLCKPVFQLCCLVPPTSCLRLFETSPASPLLRLRVHPHRLWTLRIC